MRRPVFADADRVVREDVDDRNLHDGRQADRHPAIVAEDQEAGAEGPDLDECHAIDDRPHRVLANAEMEVAAAVAAGLEVAGPLEGQPVLVEGARSAAPPISQGTFLATTFKTLPDEREAIPLASAGKAGRSLSQPSGSCRCWIL